MEKIRICPVCDQKMEGKRYCKNCRRFVKEPLTIIRNNKYRPNSVGSPIHDSDSPMSQKRTEFHPIKKQTGRQASYSPRGQDMATGRSKKPSATMLVWILLGFIFIILPLLGTGMHTFLDSVNRHIPEQSVEVTEGQESLYYTDQEVRQLGEACNGYYHFAMEGEAFREQILDWAKVNIAPLSIEIEDSENSHDVDSDTTYFETFIQLYFAGSSEPYGEWLEIGTDTVTGQIHFVNISLEDDAKWLSLTEKAMGLLSANEAGKGFDSDFDTFRQAFMAGQLNDEGEYWSSKLFHIFFCRNDDGSPYMILYPKAE